MNPEEMSGVRFIRRSFYFQWDGIPNERASERERNFFSYEYTHVWAMLNEHK